MKLICLEGCSGTGKTTQYHLLKEYFLNSDKKCLFVVEKDYEPFKTIVQKWHKEKEPSDILDLDYIISFAKAREESFSKNFAEKNLDFLIMDRYYYTSAVYQCSEKIFPEEILSINKRYGSPIPDITFLFECDPKISFERSERRNNITGGKHLFSTNTDKIKLIQNRYRTLLNICPEIEVINTKRQIAQITDELINKIKF
ncbi:Thymidylate kinase [uncultured archaeon]|nr:Thymidylate kinase [uncultured archaeon]